MDEEEEDNGVIAIEEDDKEEKGEEEEEEGEEEEEEGEEEEEKGKEESRDPVHAGKNCPPPPSARLPNLTLSLPFLPSAVARTIYPSSSFSRVAKRKWSSSSRRRADADADSTSDQAGYDTDCEEQFGMDKLLEHHKDEESLEQMFEVRDSTVAGKGLFTRPGQSGTKGMLLRFQGRWQALTPQQHEQYKIRYPEDVGNMICSSVCLMPGARWYLITSSKRCLAAVANDVWGTNRAHNAVIVSQTFDASAPKSPLAVKLIRDIHPGEEVLVKYGPQFWAGRASDRATM
jgi:hypothetical protein